MAFDFSSVHGRPLVLFGAGRCGREELGALRLRGANPLCFCDSDPRKWGTRHAGLPVMSLAGAEERFGDVLVYVTVLPPAKYHVCEQLSREGVAESRILNRPSGKRYKNCRSLAMGVANITHTDIFFCCSLGNMRNPPPAVGYADDAGGAVDAFLEFRKNIIASNQDPRSDSPCLGCPDLYDDYWGGEDDITVLWFGLPHPCQLSCTYCATVKTLVPGMNERERAKLARFDWAGFIERFLAHPRVNVSFPIQLASGELSMYPDRKRVMNAVRGKSVEVLSNCVEYDADISALVSSEGCSLNCSLDAGVRETYAAVKGRDVFDRVVANLARYCREGAHVTLKYILLPENCRDADLEGAIDIAMKNQVESLQISRDLSVSPGAVPQCVIDAGAKLAGMAAARQLPFEVLSFFREEQSR